MSEYLCKKCDEAFDDLNEFRGHNLRCKVEEKTEKKAERRKRVGVGIPRLKLSYNSQEADYVYRWVNDKDNRIENFQEGGYEFVGKGPEQEGTDVGTRISKVVMTNDDGSPRKAYLMRIKKEWYDEDQAEKHKQLDIVEKQLQGGTDSQGQPGKDGRFIPTEGTTIQRG